MPDPVYPLSALRFEVQWKGGSGSFSEVGGLDMETEVIEYRGGMDASLTARKLPGLMKYSNITLSRGIVKGDSDMFSWWTKNQQGQHERRDITITLMDEAGKPAVTWSAIRAWPVKLDGPSLNAKGTDVAVEKLELAHEGLTLKSS